MRTPGTKTLLLLVLCHQGVLCRKTIVSSSTTVKLNCQDNTTFSTQHNYTFLYNYLKGTGAHNFCSSVTFGFLATYATTPVALGAVPLAVDAVNTDPRLLPGRTLHYLAADIGTSPHRGHSSVATLAIRAMTAMRDSGTVAFIGPGDTCRAEALVAAAWNLPMIAYCSSMDIKDHFQMNCHADSNPQEAIQHQAYRSEDFSLRPTQGLNGYPKGVTPGNHKGTNFPSQEVLQPNLWPHPLSGATYISIITRWLGNPSILTISWPLEGGASPSLSATPASQE
uniref:Receptor ligand binding region domain-containing protein n=1 Tax=Timema bartmani TaxID=61472 RepID=A0A7R9EW28_9NEOP|nr:unnamed protein product [Timema bartmani]